MCTWQAAVTVSRNSFTNRLYKRQSRRSTMNFCSGAIVCWFVEIKITLWKRISRVCLRYDAFSVLMCPFADNIFICKLSFQAIYRGTYSERTGCWKLLLQLSCRRDRCLSRETLIHTAVTWFPGLIRSYASRKSSKFQYHRYRRMNDVK